MRKCTRVAICFVLVVILFVMPIDALAHPGRTDSEGGHYNRSTGEYHYHHGMEAHQHPGGICPYDYNSVYEKGTRNPTATPKPTYSITTKRPESTVKPTKKVSQYVIQPIPSISRAASSQASYKTTTAHNTGSNAEIYETNDEIANSKAKTVSVLRWILLMLWVIGPLVMSLISFARERYGAKSFILHSFDKLELRLDNCQKYEAKRTITLSRYIEHEYIRDQYLEAIKEECLLNLAVYKRLQPQSVEIDTTGYPHQRGALLDGCDIYMICYNPRSKVYHAPSCRYAKGIQLINVADMPSKATPCGVCRPSLPDMKWFQLRRYIEFLLRVYTKHKGATMKLE